MKKIKSAGFAALCLIWAALVVFGWFGPARDISETERRSLAQMPEVSLNGELEGSCMGMFEDYSLDQFPLRDTFRQIKSLFHYYVLGQSDNNDIYIADGYAAVQEYPLNEASLKYALDRFNHIYDKYLKDSGSRIWMSVVPDKGYYLAEQSGHLAMDYEALFATVAEKMPWATQVDLTETLDEGDYYRTDTHWRQENLLPTAQVLCQALGVDAFTAEELTPVLVERPFYGVYYGQAALPMDPEALYVMSGEILDGCTVYDHESGKTTAIHDMDKRTSRDLYDVFLSGAKALLTFVIPIAATDLELIVFRDSFGSSMAPLLVRDYACVTVVDIRYIASDYLDSFVAFDGQDVLFLYSTLVLNSSDTLK